MPEAAHDNAIPAIHPIHGARAVARYSMRLPFSGPASVVAGTLAFIDFSVPGAGVHGMTTE
jgi:hypothetical protein